MQQTQASIYRISYLGDYRKSRSEEERNDGLVVCGRSRVSAAGQASTCPSQTPTRRTARAYVLGLAHRRALTRNGPRAQLRYNQACSWHSAKRTANTSSAAREKSGDLRARAHTLEESWTIVARAYYFDATLHRKERESIYVYVKLRKEN